MLRAPAHDSVLLPAGVERIVHVLGPVLARNLATGRADPAIAVRAVVAPSAALVFCHVAIDGPSSLLYTPGDPVPGTDGRGICVLRTRAAIRGW